MDITYSQAYSEVLEILKHIPKIEYEKIPKEKLDFFYKNQDKRYKFKYNPNLSLSEQNVSKKANSIIVSLFLDYFANDFQKKGIKHILYENELKKQAESRLKYPPEDIFKNESKIISKEVNSLESLDIPSKNENIIVQIYKKILNFFKK